MKSFYSLLLNMKHVPIQYDVVDSLTGQEQNPVLDGTWSGPVFNYKGDYVGMVGAGYDAHGLHIGVVWNRNYFDHSSVNQRMTVIANVINV